MSERIMKQRSKKISKFNFAHFTFANHRGMARSAFPLFYLPKMLYALRFYYFSAMGNSRVKKRKKDLPKPTTAIVTAPPKPLV